MRKLIVGSCTLLLLSLGAAFGAWMWLSETGAGTMAPAPAAITRLTQDQAMDIRPAWSPDNRWIAFESNREGGIFHIYVMKADGSELRALTRGENDDQHPSWSPDGKTILFDSSDGIHQDIWAVNVADGNKRQLTHVDGLAECAASSPDGQRIAFYIYKDMTLNIWSARADGSDARPLTRDLADAMRQEPTMAWHAPAWSPDSQWLAYTGGDGKSIWMMRADGSNPRSIISDGETNHFPWFLCDGRLAYITEYVPPQYGGAWTNAWAYDLKTGERSLLEEYMSMQGPVDWNSDHSEIVFHSPRAGSFDVYLINLNAPGGLAALQGKNN